MRKRRGNSARHGGLGAGGSLGARISFESCLSQKGERGSVEYKSRSGQGQGFQGTSLDGIPEEEYAAQQQLRQQHHHHQQGESLNAGGSYIGGSYNGGSYGGNTSYTGGSFEPGTFDDAPWKHRPSVIQVILARQ